MANEKIKPVGIITFPKNPKSPDFVLGTAVITIDDFTEWVRNNAKYLTEYKGKRQLKLQMLKSKEGGIYFQVDTYKPKDNF